VVAAAVTHNGPFRIAPAIQGIWSARDVSDPRDVPGEPITLDDFMQLDVASRGDAVTCLSTEDLCRLRFNSADDYSTWRARQLQVVLKARGLPISGSKAVMVARLCAEPEVRDPVVEAHKVLLSTSFNKPVKSAAVREYFDIGHANEGAAIAQLTRRCPRGPCYDLVGGGAGTVAFLYLGEVLTECGTLCHKAYSALTASPDGICAEARTAHLQRACLQAANLSVTERPELRWVTGHLADGCDVCHLSDAQPALLEVKTAISDDTRKEQRAIIQAPLVAAAIGRDQQPLLLLSVDSSEGGSGPTKTAFRALVPLRRRRMQLIHQAAVTGVNTVIYTSCEPGRLLFAAVVHLPDAILSAHLSLCRTIYDAMRERFGAFESDATESIRARAHDLGVTYITPPLYLDMPAEFDWGYAVDGYTAHLHMALRERLFEWTINHERPLPELQGIKLLLNLLYNRIKAGVDNRLSQLLRRTARNCHRANPGTWSP
jgi:hypothetical protein